MSGFSELAAADAYCRLLARRHYENFEVASWLLPGQLRRHLARLYAYCRMTDDLGDESGDEARARLHRWREEVGGLFRGEPPVHPVLVALRDSVERFQLPAQPFTDLIEANLQDQEVTSYESWPDLEAYCMRSAAPVGRVVLRLFGLADPMAERWSDDVCIGLQLANFAQDVAVDATKGRCYLIRPEVDRLGVAGAVRAHCERARALLASGRELERVAPGRLRLQLALYRLGGLAICDAIARVGYRTDRVRPRVSLPVKAGLVLEAVRPGGGRHARGVGAT
ncbi:MAG TPA: squalene/phytoene synthase family protein [Candidatus Dormibacteraeota bacterium]|nr:squalene/phytoene synthase family protein [Candidatus Dormibacteraeota bacterium]